MIELKTILKLKRTLSPKTLSPMNYREIAKLAEVTPAGVHYAVKSQLPDMHKRCPQCLQELEEK